MIKTLYGALFTDDDTHFFKKSSGNITFFGYEKGILDVDLDIINPDDANFDEDDLETIYL